MEKNNSLFSIRNIIIVLLLTISIYTTISNIRDKNTISSLENAIKAERNIAIGFEYTNRELRQNIDKLYKINSGFEESIRNIERTEEGFNDTNNKFGREIEELRRISQGFESGDRYSGERIEQIEEILNSLENANIDNSSGSGL